MSRLLLKADCTGPFSLFAIVDRLFRLAGGQLQRGVLIAALLLSLTPLASGAQAQDVFITTLETTSADESIEIPTENSTVDYDFEVDRGMVVGATIQA